MVWSVGAGGLETGRPFIFEQHLSRKLLVVYSFIHDENIRFAKAAELN